MPLEFFDYCNNGKTPGTVKTVPYKPPIKENQTGKNRNFRKYYRRSRKTGAGGRGVKKCVLTIFGQLRTILSADAASEVRKARSKKRR